MLRTLQLPNQKYNLEFLLENEYKMNYIYFIRLEQKLRFDTPVSLFLYCIKDIEHGKKEDGLDVERIRAWMKYYTL